MKSGRGAASRANGEACLLKQLDPWSHRSGALGRGSLSARQGRGRGQHFPSLCRPPIWAGEQGKRRAAFRGLTGSETKMSGT